MTEATKTQGFTREAFDAFLQSRQEPAWLRDLRNEAWQHFESLPLPSQRDEEWMRTDIRMFHLDRYALKNESAADADVPDPLLTRGVDLAGQDAALDSRSLASRLRGQLAEQGVLFGSLDELAREHGDLVRRYLFKSVDPFQDKFAALHAAAWSGGTLLYVPRGVVIDEPLHMLSVLTAGASDFGHALVILEEGAEATLLAETASLAEGAGGLHCGAIELFVGPRARLRYVNLQNWGTGVWHFAHQKARVDAGGALQWTIAALGSRLAKVNQHVALVGAGADAQVNGVMFTEGKQHLSYHTLQHHEGATAKATCCTKSPCRIRRAPCGGA